MSDKQIMIVWYVAVAAFAITGILAAIAALNSQRKRTGKRPLVPGITGKRIEAGCGSVLALAAIGVVGYFLISACTSDPCRDWDELDAKAFAEGAYDRYETELESLKRLCLAQTGQ